MTHTTPDDAKETLTIQRSWFETLAKLSKQANKDMEKWYESEKMFLPSSMNKLIGYASSAETFLELFPNKNHERT